LNDCIDRGVEFAAATRYVTTRPDGVETIVRLDRDGRPFEVKAKVVVGADGAVSRVARDLGLPENREWIVGYEEIHPSTGGEPALHCFLDAELAPGYLAWVSDDGDEMHVGVGGYAASFDPRATLQQFKMKFARVLTHFKFSEPSETRGGRIPVGGVLQNISNVHGLLVGDAAGAVSPLTAGGLDPCIRLSTYAAQTILRRLETDDAGVMHDYSGRKFRARFVSRLWMRRAIAFVKSQTILEAGCWFLRRDLGKRFAAHVFFGRGSFPDVPVRSSVRKIGVVNS
jgi:flavin-dependent dehydrogenase